MHNTQQPLQNLAPSNCSSKCDTPCIFSISEGYHGIHWRLLLLWFLIITAMAWIIFFSFLAGCNGSPWGPLLLWWVIIAVIVFIILF